MKIFVTGATGTVGGAVVGDLLKRGASVRALSRKQPEPAKPPQSLEIALGDLPIRRPFSKHWMESTKCSS